MESHYNPPSAVSSAEVPLQTLMNGVGAVSKSLEGVGVWQLLLTVLVLSVTYDQGMGNEKPTTERTASGSGGENRIPIPPVLATSMDWTG